MDSRVHPDVVRGQKANDLISDVSFYATKSFRINQILSTNVWTDCLQGRLWGLQSNGLLPIYLDRSIWYHHWFTKVKG